VFWVKPKNKTPENDTWELIYSLITPISLASKIDEVVATAQDHLSIWNSMKKVDSQRFAGQYEDTPRGRILYNKGIFIVLVGNFACKTDQEFSGSKDISKDVKPNIKKMIELEYNLDNPTWMHDLHYDIEGMTPESDDFEDDEEWEEFDEEDNWEDDDE
jgi:hypothetical protein